MSATNLNTARPEWMSAQVTVNSRSDFKIVMEGKATNGGYAIDQLVFSPGKCSRKSPKCLAGKIFSNSLNII
jgi:hypothetical protein